MSAKRVVSLFTPLSLIITIILFVFYLLEIDIKYLVYAFLITFIGFGPMRRVKLSKRKATLSLIDTYIINCIYMFSLSIICGYLLYSLIIVERIDLQWSVLVSVGFLLLEAIWLFYGKEMQIEDSPLPELNHWYSYSPGTLVSTLLMLPYLAIRLRDRTLFGWDGLRSVWANTRYRILNPNWLHPSNDKKLRINRRRGTGISCLERLIARLTAIYRRIVPNVGPD